MEELVQLLLLIVLMSLVVQLHGQRRHPNFVLIFADDFGYGDLHSYGHPSQEKNAIDQLATEGLRFTQWYSADSLCTPSRAAILTGRLPVRSGIVGPNRLFWPMDSGGLPKNETTIAEALKELGYATGIVGKWHLGINEFMVNDGNHLPHHHGFQFVGASLPFTFHWRCDPKKFSIEEMSIKCFLYDNTTMIQQPIDPEKLTSTIAEDAVKFITSHKSSPFFLYLAMPQTHTAMICSSQFCNTSKRGRYGDNVNEMAWAVGEVVSTLRDLDIENNTMVLFTSDHGPHVEMCNDGGSAGMLKGGKASSWEGGVRVPAIAWWPGTIAAGGVSSEVVSTLDVFPTLLKLAGGNLSSNNVLDGVTLDDLFTGYFRSGVDPPKHDVLFHYCSDRIMAVRIGRYKLHYYTHDPFDNVSLNCADGEPFDDVMYSLDCSAADRHEPPLTYDMLTDPGERYPLDPARHREVIERARQLVEAHRETVVPVPSQLGAWNHDLQPCCKPPVCRCGYIGSGPNSGA